MVYDVCLTQHAMPAEKGWFLNSCLIVNCVYVYMYVAVKMDQITHTIIFKHPTVAVLIIAITITIETSVVYSWDGYSLLASLQFLPATVEWCRQCLHPSCSPYQNISIPDRMVLYWKCTDLNTRLVFILAWCSDLPSELGGILYNSKRNSDKRSAILDEARGWVVVNVSLLKLGLRCLPNSREQRYAH